ncbi:MAG: hypothetical protein RLZZ436_2295 [Planctomycetota bacterium]
MSPSSPSSWPDRPDVQSAGTADTADAAPGMLAWDPFAYALGELPPAAQACFEERMAADPELCEEFLAALRLLAALSSPETGSTRKVAASQLSRPHSPARGRRLTAILAASTALAAATLSAFSLHLHMVPTADSLRDAVALSSILQQVDSVPELPAEPVSDSDAAAMPLGEDLETPGWLLTAVDLDEQPSTSDIPPSDDEEAIF